MDILATTLIYAIVLGIGATITFDLWAQFLKQVFKIAPSNICLVGRWVLYMREGVFKHANITSTPARRSECAVGWIAHYGIGVLLAMAFVALVGNNWRQHPTLLPAVVYGLVTVLAPFCIMQPSFGLGFAARKTPRPGPARIRSVMNHIAYGAGLFLFAVLVNGLRSA